MYISTSPSLDTNPTQNTINNANVVYKYISAFLSFSSILVNVLYSKSQSVSTSVIQPYTQLSTRYRNQLAHQPYSHIPDSQPWPASPIRMSIWDEAHTTLRSQNHQNPRNDSVGATCSWVGSVLDGAVELGGSKGKGGSMKKLILAGECDLDCNLRRKRAAWGDYRGGAKHLHHQHRY